MIRLRAAGSLWIKWSYANIKANTFKVDPQIVGVKDLEFADYDTLKLITCRQQLDGGELTRLELFGVFWWYLSNFKKTNRPFIVDQSSTLSEQDQKLR